MDRGQVTSIENTSSLCILPVNIFREVSVAVAIELHPVGWTAKPLTDWGNCLVMNLLGQAVGVLPPELIPLQDHHSTVICVSSLVVGMISTPEGVS